MTPRKLLLVFWNQSGFLFEFFGSFTLVFFVLIWILIKFIQKPKNDKFFTTLGFTAATFLAFIIPWALSYFTSQSRATPFINPVNVILQSKLQSFNIRNSEQVAETYKGTFYLIGGQFAGGLSGFLIFSLLFYLIKRSLLKNEECKENIQTLQIWDILKVPHNINNSWWKYLIKEFVFISIFVVVVPMINYIENAEYGTNGIWKLVITLIIVWIFLFISSYFGFFAFDIVFNVIAYILFLIEVLYKWNNKNLKNIKNVIILEHIKISIVIIFTILIPFIYGTIAIEIAKSVKIRLNF
ncbi:hypothetical protein BCF59_0310 [Mycoplasmopsis mustelae]|uniref:Transmembrane protein n=1 Tax=Mycoplasmopsis mustelae TaxID=171289 RepID=A0A4R7UD55_9BACT|nr:hypothetical protein [Mycoplasmopsis mustelae]TDV24349.1 hypothetical protein BCF59_0310 [Mycoplasmopsis mustelae]